MLQLATSGRKTMTIASRDALTNATVIDGQLQGWVLLQDLTANPSSHPIPYFYLYDNITLKRWVSYRVSGTYMRYVKLAFLRVASFQNQNPTSMDVATFKACTAENYIGGITSPVLGKHIWSDSYRNGIIEVKNAPIAGIPYNAGFEVALPLVGGKSHTDALKSCLQPGPSMVLWHDGPPFFPASISPSGAIPTYYTPATFDFGYYDAVPTWFSLAIINPKFQFVQLGSMTPTQLQTSILANRLGHKVFIDDGFFDDSYIIWGRGFRTSSGQNRTTGADVLSLSSK